MLLGWTVLIGLVGSALLLWSAALVTTGLSGGGWGAGSASGGAGVFLIEILSGTSPSDAWRQATTGSAELGPAWLFWTVLVLMVALVVGAVLFGRRLLGRRTKESRDARWATRRDERPMTVADDPDKRPHRLVAGRSKTTGRCLAGEDCVSAVAFGPNGSGKTVGLIIPNVLEWAGSVVMTTAKPQDLLPVLADAPPSARCG